MATDEPMSMPTILIPLAGEGSRFPRSIWKLPKPMVLIDDRSIIEWSMDCIDWWNCNLIFIVRDDHVKEFSIDGFLREKFGPQIKIVIAPEITRGSVETCLAAEKLISPNEPLTIHCSDVYFEPQFCSDFQSDSDGCILTFKSNSPNYSYSSIDENGFVTKVAEKKVISNNASAGIYWFKRGKDFISAAKKMIREDRKTNGEYFICPLYQILIDDGKKITTSAVDKMSIFGTAEEYKFFVENSLRTFSHKKKVAALCSDHSGFKAKNSFKQILAKKGIKYIDFGTFNDADTDYCQFVAAAAKAVLENKCDFGVGFCRSGQGVNIAANKIKGIRSAWVNSDWLAEMAIRHNAANFLAISQELNTDLSMENIIDAFLTNTFDGGRHQVRLSQNDD